MSAKLLCIAVLSTFAWSVGAIEPDTDNRCPKLPDKSGLVWSYQAGPDFDVCYASNANKSEPKVVIGVYLGNHPQFSLKDQAPISEGKLSGVAVKWYKKESTSPAYAGYAGLQALLYKDSQPVAHVWL